MGLLISTIGIYGVISFTVARRTREIGVRMALGARRGQVLGMVLRHGLALALAGSAIGLGPALALHRVAASLLYGVSPTDTAYIPGCAGSRRTDRVYWHAWCRRAAPPRSTPSAPCAATKPRLAGHESDPGSPAGALETGAGSVQNFGQDLGGLDDARAGAVEVLVAIGDR